MDGRRCEIDSTGRTAAAVQARAETTPQERSARRLWALTITIGLSALVVGVAAGRSEQPGTVIKGPLRVVDGNGRTLLDIRQTEVGPELRLLQADGRPAAELTAMGAGAQLMLYGRVHGATRATALLDNHTGGAELVLFDGAGHAGIHLFALNSEGTADGLAKDQAMRGIQIEDESGKHDAMWLAVGAAGRRLAIRDSRGKRIFSAGTPQEPRDLMGKPYSR
jgi:hypothetical protein